MRNESKVELHMKLADKISKSLTYQFEWKIFVAYLKKIYYI